jgi:hypothetical protein
MPIEPFANNPSLIMMRGPVVACVVGLPIAQPQPQNQPIAINPGDLHQIGALLDTGASNCCINPSLANRLNLPIAGYGPMTDASGNTTTSKIRSGCLGFLLKGGQIFKMFSAIPFIELPKDLPHHTVVIGRNMMASFKSLYFTFNTGEYMIHF